ncbi:MAG: nucleotidyl transferase AbiEii/AbiGii toxin family protein [Flavobacteriaceae bacterium]|nr:nucleotidyl transferase AbiEii/AbiGii toxin family protein [Flavobacteriaceae bacterium]
MLIKKEQIIEWGEQQKFQDDKQAEKDLYIEFFLNALFKLQYFLKHLVFKGGTALHKIHLKKSLRFSEDIDLEHRDNKKLKSTLKAIDLFFKKKNFNKKIRKKKNNYEISAIYQSEITEESGKLKIEISPREDFSIFGLCSKTVPN